MEAWQKIDPKEGLKSLRFMQNKFKAKIWTRKSRLPIHDGTIHVNRFLQKQKWRTRTAMPIKKWALQSSLTRTLLAFLVQSPRLVILLRDTSYLLNIQISRLKLIAFRLQEWCDQRNAVSQLRNPAEKSLV